MNLIRTITILSSLLLAIESCISQQEFKERQVIVKKDETVTIKELGLKITNKGCGREWLSSGGGESYEKGFCDLTYILGDSTKTGGNSFKPVYFGNIEIKIEKMNVWGKEEDGVPAGACRLYIRKLEQLDATGK